jgi:hypothetical protein
MLTHLENVAERTNSAFLLVGHVTKGNGKAQHRGLGSIDILNRYLSDKSDKTLYVTNSNRRTNVA